MSKVSDAFVIDGTRTPIGRYGGGLSSVRADDLGALPMAALVARNSDIDPAQIDDVVFGCANQAGEDNRNVARMSTLLAGLPVDVPAVTVNRLCGSGMNAAGMLADAIRVDTHALGIAGGVESMSRAPFVLGKQESAFGRKTDMFDTTLGWRFVNRKLESQYGIDSMAETAENVAEQFGVTRDDQDAFALRSQQRAEAAADKFADEITPVQIPQRKGEPLTIERDEHPRAGSTLAGLQKLRPIVRPDGTITAGNASGINDGAAALLIGNQRFADAAARDPLARIVAWAVSGVEPRIMGIGPVSAAEKALKKAQLSIGKMDVIELNEAFAAQGLASLRQLGIDDDAEHVNPNGGAIALGHPLGMSGARLILTAAHELRRTQGRYALCTMCVGVGQGIAMIIERT